MKQHMLAMTIAQSESLHAEKNEQEK